MGVLEQIDMKLDALLELMGANDEVNEVPFKKVLEDAASADPVAFSSVVDEVVNAAAVEVDSNGIPWDERIHAGTKGKTEKGVWKKKRGVNDKLFNDVVAELKASNEVQESGQTAPDPTTTPSVPSVPTAPGVPTAPTVPGAPTATNYKRLAITAINEITDKHGVEYSMLDEVFAQFGTKDFTLMPEEHHEGFQAIVDEYSCDLNDVLDLVKSITGIAGEVEVDKFFATHFNALKYNQVPRTKLKTAIDALTPWNQQLIDWQAKQQG